MSRDKRISVQIREGVPMSEALALVSAWYREHEKNPDRWPMRGIFHMGYLKCCRRDYRKTDCFLVWKDTEETA